NGGAIGFVTATRPVNAATNAFLNEAFYNALFFKENGRYRDLGTIFKETKNNSLNGVSNRNFSLLADPSMHLAIPNHEVVATKISTVDGSDILKALSKVQIEGEVQLNGVKVSDYNGTVLVVLKDKEFTFKTLGDENPIFTYGERSNTLFRGEASVVDGAFTIEFIIPKNIAYQVGNGKLSMYASSDDKSIDAAGGSIDFKIGESELDDGSDNTPPMIKLFMSDSTFVDGGVTGSSTLLLAKLSDQSGINIANYGVGNNLVAILDNDQTFELGEYYVAKLDDYTQGTIHFPMEDLAPGKHTLEVKAWDVYNNGSSSRINFVVTSDNQLIIEELKNYPNPFSDITTIQFSHNRSGEDLEAFVTIFDNAGRPVATMNYEIANSQYLVTLLDWNGTNTAGSKLGNGIYLLRLSVRSLLDGSKNEQISKLIILN
ncbi:MAG: C25 family cysteine peptidase, partial [Cyclobacteriaceae bacterium]|nr:C25 family cysteine peptidase [Cyclobacteriaceae bacterium]